LPVDCLSLVQRLGLGNVIQKVKSLFDDNACKMEWFMKMD